MQRGLDGSRPAVQKLCDIGLREVVDVAKGDRQPLAFVQTGEQIEEVVVGNGISRLRRWLALEDR